MRKKESPEKREEPFEDVAECHRVALKHYVDLHTEEKFRADLFKPMKEKYPNISLGNLKNFIKGKSPLSEKKRIQVASFLGFRYEEFIALGRKLMDLKESGMLPDEPDAEALSLNRAAGKIFQEFQDRHDLSDMNMAHVLGMDSMEYSFKKRGLIPFSFEEIETAFQEADEKAL